jgi:hypothetical protein
LGFWGEDNLRAFKREFGAKLNDFMISMRAPDLKQAQRLIDLAGE